MKKILDFEYSDARCGAGKTKFAMELMAATPGQYVYVVDRRDVYEERIRRVREIAQAASTYPTIDAIHSDDERTKLLPSVRQRIEEAGYRHCLNGHVVLIITHEAMKTADFSRFVGWTIVIDETPNIIEHVICRTPASYHHFKAAYELSPSEFSPTWNRITARQAGIALSDLARDEVMDDWVAFHRRVLSGQPVMTKLASFEEMDEWSWWSIWSPHALAPFERRIILANAFTDTITYKLIRHHWPEIEFQPLVIGSPVVWQHRPVTIRYFAQHHRASASFFTTEDGQKAMTEWAKWVTANTDSPSHFWASNNRHRGALRIGGSMVSIKIAGSNAYRDRTQASVLYSAKATPAERTLFREFGIEPADVMRAREYEDIIQVLFRSSLRLADDTRPLEWNVYDRGQAEFLADYLTRNGFPVTVSLEYIDLGTDVQAKSKMVQNELRSDEENAARAERRRLNAVDRKREARAEEREAAKEAGTYRPRGRPRVQKPVKEKRPRGRPRKISI